LLQYLLPIHSILATIELVALHIITTKHVFFENAPIANANPQSFKPLNGGYAMDKYRITKT